MGCARKKNKVSEIDEDIIESKMSKKWQRCVRGGSDYLPKEELF